MSSTYRRSAQRVHWGEGALDRLPAEMARVGARRALILCGESVGAHPRLVPRIEDLLGTSVVGVSTDVRSHTPAKSVEDIAELLTAAGADSVIVIGGGSAFVTARAACVLHGEGRPLESLCTRRNPEGILESPRLLAPKLPVFAVPTTPTTATNKAGAAVTMPGHGERLTMLDQQTRARSVLIDPEYLASSPPDLVRQASLNALVMAVEGLCTGRSHIFSDAALVHATRQLADMAPALATGAISARHRMDAALASLLVGEGTDSSGGGLTAALSHTIGHQYGAHNGTIDALLLPHVLDQVPPSKTAARRISQAIGGEPAQSTSRLRALLASAGATARLRDIGVERGDIDRLADEAMSDVAYARSSTRPGPNTLTAILRAAW